MFTVNDFRTNPDLSDGSVEALHSYMRLTGEKLSLAEVINPDPAVASSREIERARLDRWRRQTLAKMALPYQYVGTPLAVAAMLSLLWLCWRSPSEPGSRVFTVICLALLGAVGARILLVALVDATSFPGIRADYLSSAYPLFIAFCFCACVWGITGWKQSRQGDEAAMPRP